MSDINIDPHLYEQITRAAGERDIPPSKLLAEAVQSYLRQLDKDRLSRELEAFLAMHPELVDQYLDQYVAIHQGEVVDHDGDFINIHDRVRQRFGQQPVLIRRVTGKPEREWVFRSPRFESDQE